MEQHPDSPARRAPAAQPPATLPDDTPPPQIYDPADYRWVPVRRVPRYGEWTEEKMRRFIECLADTGLVSHAAKAVGMSRESAYKLRRAPHGAAFARAWDAARHHAGHVLEDVAFDRAIEGAEQLVFNEYGEVVCTKNVPNDRMLMFLLRHLKPERYGALAQAQDAPPPAPVEESLRALEPAMPAAPEQLLGPDQMEAELEIADIADGALPRYLSEQRPEPSPEQLAARRGAAATEKVERGEKVSDAEFAAYCRYVDPSLASERPRRLYR